MHSPSSIGAWSRAFLLAISLVLAVAGALLAGASAAQAAPPCYHSTCVGKNPQTLGCGADATTLDEFTRSGQFRVELRRSALCGAAWTRITTFRGAPITACDINYAQIRSYTSTDALKDQYWAQSVCNGSGATTTGGQAYTKMVSFGDYVRACITDYKTSPPKACTARH